MNNKYDLLNINAPVIFTDGTATFSKLAETYRAHSKGYFILAPSGAGKTHFINSQKQHDWIDGDDLWQETFALPEGPWWLEPLERVMEIEARCDAITLEAKRLGFRVIGGSNTWLRPDAVAIPSWQTHRKYVVQREKNGYDGGATTEELEGLKRQRRWFARWTKQGVPKFSSVQEAADYLASLP
jgi:hypothetical protein